MTDIDDAERVVQEVAQRNRQGVAAFRSCLRQALKEALTAGQTAVDAGEPLERAETVFSFVRDAGFAKAACSLPLYYFDVREFEKMPVIDVSTTALTQAPEGWSRWGYAGTWIAVHSNIDGYATFWRIEIEDSAPFKDRLS